MWVVPSLGLVVQSSVRKEAEPQGTNQQATLLHGLEVLERIWNLKESEYF